MDPGVDILWPDMDRYLAMWEKAKATDRFAVGRAMQDAMRAAGVQPPEWPPKPPAKAPEKPQETPPSGSARGGDGPSWDAPKGGDLDDEIPF